MILAMYLMCKILCYSIFTKQEISNAPIKSTQIKRNLKTITSIYYRATIEHYSEGCPIIREIKSMEDFSDATAKNKLKQKTLYDKNVKFNGEVEPNFHKASVEYDKKYKTLYNNEREEVKVLKKILKKLPNYKPDTNKNEFEVLDKECYKSKDLKGYEQMAAQNNFNIKDKIVAWIDKFYDLIINKSQRLETMVSGG